MQGFGLTFREEKGAQMTPTELLTTAEPYKGALCSVLLSLVLPKTDTVQALEFTGLSPPSAPPAPSVVHPPSAFRMSVETDALGAKRRLHVDPAGRYRDPIGA